MDDLIEIVKSLEDSGLLLEGVTESVQNEIKEQKGRFLYRLSASGLLGKLGIKTPLSKITILGDVFFKCIK